MFLISIGIPTSCILIVFMRQLWTMSATSRAGKLKLQPKDVVDSKAVVDQVRRPTLPLILR
jgi:hypothetical protein